MTALSVRGPGAVAALAPPPWRRWFAELWWLLRTADALTVITLVMLGRRLRAIPPMVRMPLASLALVGFMAFKAVSGYLADPRPLVAALTAPLLIVGAFCLFLAWVCSGLAPVKVKGGHGGYTTVRKTITGNTKMVAHYASSPTKMHTSWFIAKHEGGHAAAAEGVGGRALESRVYSWGGWCSAILPRHGTPRERVIRYVAFLAGGEVAVNSRSGCGHDQENIEWAINMLPADQRGGVRSAGYAKARAAQSSHASLRNAVARSLVRHGRWGSGGGGHYSLPNGQ